MSKDWFPTKNKRKKWKKARKKCSRCLDSVGAEIANQPLDLQTLLIRSSFVYMHQWIQRRLSSNHVYWNNWNLIEIIYFFLSIPICFYFNVYMNPNLIVYFHRLIEKLVVLFLLLFMSLIFKMSWVMPINRICILISFFLSNILALILTLSNSIKIAFLAMIYFAPVRFRAANPHLALYVVDPTVLHVAQWPIKLARQTATRSARRRAYIAVSEGENRRSHTQTAPFLPLSLCSAQQLLNVREHGELLFGR